MRIERIREKIKEAVRTFDILDIDREDIIQDVTIKIWQEIESGRKIESFEDFIYIVTKNYILDWEKMRKRSLDAEYKHKDYLKRVEGEKIKNPNIVAMREDFENELDKLPEQQRKVMELTYEGCSNKEVAEELNKTINCIKVELHIARKKLQKKLCPERTALKEV